MILRLLEKSFSPKTSNNKMKNADIEIGTEKWIGGVGNYLQIPNGLTPVTNSFISTCTIEFLDYFPRIRAGQKLNYWLFFQFALALDYRIFVMEMPAWALRRMVSTYRLGLFSRDFILV